jgi:hypothetical protein
MKIVCSSETSVSYQITLCYITADGFFAVTAVENLLIEAVHRKAGDSHGKKQRL